MICSYSLCVDPAILRILIRWMAIVWVVTESMKSRSCVIRTISPFHPLRNWTSHRIETMSR